MSYNVKGSPFINGPVFIEGHDGQHAIVPKNYSLVRNNYKIIT